MTDPSCDLGVLSPSSQIFLADLDKLQMFIVCLCLCSYKHSIFINSSIVTQSGGTKATHRFGCLSRINIFYERTKYGVGDSWNGMLLKFTRYGSNFWGLRSDKYKSNTRKKGLKRYDKKV